MGTIRNIGELLREGLDFIGMSELNVASDALKNFVKLDKESIAVEQDGASFEIKFSANGFEGQMVGKVTNGSPYIIGAKFDKGEHSTNIESSEQFNSVAKSTRMDGLISKKIKGLISVI